MLPLLENIRFVEQLLISLLLHIFLSWVLFLFSAKQNELQEDYYAVEAKRAELQRIMDAEGRINQQFSIKITFVMFYIDERYMANIQNTLKVQTHVLNMIK